MRFRPTKLALISATILVVSTSGMRTVQGGPTMRDACASDVQKLCPGLEKNEVRECLKTHRGQLSDECKTALKEAKAVRDACASDLQKLCPGLEKNEVRECLKTHRGQLSDECKTALKEAKARR